MKAAPDRSRAARAVPFDLAAADAMPGWREGLAWPQAVAPVRQAMAGRMRAALALTGTFSDDTRRAALLALGRCFSGASALIECALLVEAERRTGVTVSGGPEEIAWLRGRGGTPPATPQRAGQVQDAINAPFMRRLARTASWTPWWQLPATLLAPHAVAVSHNAMLRDGARRRRVRFAHGDTLLDAARRGARGPAVDTRAAAESLAAVIAAVPEIGEDTAARLHTVVAPKVRAHLAQAADDLAAVAAFRDAPLHVWSGSAGSYPARAFGLEAMRRGGTATRFDHGGSAGMTDDPDPLILREGCVSTRFVAATEGVARLCRGLDEGCALSLPRAEIAGGRGEPHLRQAARLAPAPRRPRPKVIYASGAIYGFRQIVPPVARDPVYIDWQMRLAEMLLALPADVLLKPHPEGIFRGKPHPLTTLGPSTGARFEAVMAEADSYVFDFPLSTAFWTALCSDRSVVFVDLGLAPFHPEVRAMIGRRCRVVTARWGEDNLPRVESHALEDALFATDTPDPAPFRRLLAGIG